MSVAKKFFGINIWIRALILFVLSWGFLVYFFISKINTQSFTEPETALRKINQAIYMLEQSKQRSEELKQLFDDIKSEQPNQTAAQKLIKKLKNKLQENLSEVTEEPSTEYERLRRRIYQNTQELWNFLNSELTQMKAKINQNDPEAIKNIDNLIEKTAEHKRSLLYDINKLKSVDGHEDWRKIEAKELSDMVQRRLYNLQNPKDCKNARKLICKLNKGCGYGCQIHHVVYCFFVAYATERTLILQSVGWKYHKQGWESVFQPVSQTCVEIEGNVKVYNWPGDHDTQVVKLPIIDSLVSRPPYLPLSIPADLAPRLNRLHGDPIVWWVGQILKYLLRPQENTRQLIDAGTRKLGIKHPIVGVHIRRTDKVGSEAAFHSVEEYMKHVEDYYLQLEINGSSVKRRVFLASDDPNVLDEARKKYPLYEIIGDPNVAKMAALSTRYSDTSLNGIILDIHMLSLCDYLVCTFSSQVCRVAYEIMQTFHPDASNYFKSLDDIYYFGGQNAHNRIAVIKHQPNNNKEIELQPGDLIGIAGNHWNGYSKGTNRRTNKVGLFPSFKVNDKIETVELPTYSNNE